MALKYFSNFPSVEYNNKIVKNIALRAKLLDLTKKTKTAFYPYTIKDGERPDMVAYNYYGHSDFVWIIFLANDIINPFYDWPLSQYNFDKYIKSKYGSFAEAAQKIIKYVSKDRKFYYNYTNSNYINEIEYASLSSSDQSNWILYIQNDKIEISPDTYDFLENGQQTLYQEVNAYDDEFDKNEKKRNIRLLNNLYAPTFQKELETLLQA